MSEVKFSSFLREFWSSRVMGADVNPISDEDCEKVIKILDRNGKGNNKDTEAVARAIMSQGAWRLPVLPYERAPSSAAHTPG